MPYEDTSLTTEKLIEQIQYVYETDFGDFKRKVALYLNRFSQTVKGQNLQKKIQNLKDFTLYSEAISTRHMESIDHLRFALLEKLKELQL